MGFFKNLRFWKRRRNDTVTSRDIATTTDNLTVENGTQVSSIDMILKLDAGTQVGSNRTREASTQTSNPNEKPNNRTDGGAADKEGLKRKIAALEYYMEEKELEIRKQNATIKEMEERKRSEIQYILTKEEMEKRSLLRKIREMREEIIDLKERRPPKEERAEPSAEQERDLKERRPPNEKRAEPSAEQKRDLKERRPPKEKRAEPSAERKSVGPGWNHVDRRGYVFKNERRPPKEKRAEPSAEQESLGPGWNHVVRGGHVVKAATPEPAPEVTVHPRQATVTESQRRDHTGRREAGRSRNCQQSAYERYFPNLPPRQQDRNLPPRMQSRNLPPRLQNKK